MSGYSDDMSSHVAIEVRGLNKTFGSRKPVRAVRDLSFSVAPGKVTGFLGPNGSGKTTTLRTVLGLVRPTSGDALIQGQHYSQLAHPQRVVGAALEASGVHPGRTAQAHLQVLCAAGGIPYDRVPAVLEEVGLTEAASRKVGGFSLGMRQRLALAGALLGDPAILVLDEPANGLDPEGIAWLRHTLRNLAAEGKAVLISSHVLSEVQLTVDDVVIISKGALVTQCPLAELSAGPRQVLVRSADDPSLARAINEESGNAASPAPGGGLLVTGADSAAIGRIALTRQIPLIELREHSADLESVFLELTHAEVSA